MQIYADALKRWEREGGRAIISKAAVVTHAYDITHVVLASALPHTVHDWQGKRENISVSSPTTNCGMQKWKLSREYVHVAYTVFARSVPICMLGRRSSTKFLQRSSVTILLRVRCRLGSLCWWCSQTQLIGEQIVDEKIPNWAILTPPILAISATPLRHP